MEEVWSNILTMDVSSLLASGFTPHSTQK